MTSGTINTKSGLTGWLSPSGIFYKCEYNSHHHIAERLITTDSPFANVEPENELEAQGYIKLASGGMGNEDLSYIYIPQSGVKEEQLYWLQTHVLDMDEVQISMLHEYFYLFKGA